MSAVPAVAQLLGTQELTARHVVELLDAAGIRQALPLSVAYLYGSPARRTEDEPGRVRGENDWTAAQAAQDPARLRAFGGFNPLKDYAVAELERCAAEPALRHGIKLHFGNSDVQLDLPDHVDRLGRVFRAANAHGMAIVVHLRASLSRQRRYGAAQARIFLERVLPFAPDVPVQVAHLAGTGPGYDDEAAQAAMEHVLFGSDAAVGDNLRPREAWAALRRLPLRAEEFAAIAGNVAPYLR